jgi:arginine deiminase
MQLHIDNEYDPLEAVLVHRPGDEIDRLNYHNMRQYLFEDIPYLARMQEEHDEFVSVMRAHGVEVVYIEDLLKDLLEHEPRAASKLFNEVCAAEGCPEVAERLLSAALTPADRLRILFAGLTRREYRSLGSEAIGAADDIEDFILSPIPNAYFSRDPAVVVNNTLISCKMHYLERVRETILTRAIIEMHPTFKGADMVYGGSASRDEDRPYTVEGGDVTVLGPQALMIGVSERSTWQAVERIARNAFEHGHIERLYEIRIPAHRDYMHLDTIFTVVDRGTVVWYAPVMENVCHVERYEPAAPRGRAAPRRVVENRSLRDILSAEFDCDLTVIPTGGGHAHYAPREQRTDGTNVLAIAPRKVIMYDRNFKTKEELERHGVETISIGGSELVRGLGGPRCMSMPLRRRPSAG